MDGLSIVALSAEDASRLAAHLLRLCPADRSLRFAAGLVTDETIRRYVAGIRFATDAVLGLVDAQGSVVGFAHGCVYSSGGRTHIEAAFSVDAERRRLGFGTRLMRAVESFAEDTGADALVGICVSRNLPMRRIFERTGMTMSREDDEMHAFRRLDAARCEAAFA